jgi:autotransporter-associated beta strand protein
MKALLIAASSLYVVTSHAADISKLGTGTNLADAASWTDSVVPGSSDIATWGGTSLATGLTLGTNVEWQGVRISGSSGSGTVSVTGAGTLSLGASGINLEGSVVSATFANALSLTAAQSWRVNAGRTLTLSGPIVGSSAVSIGSAPARTSSLFLTSAYQTIATGITLADVTGISGLLGGSWINSQRSTSAHGYLVSSSATSQVYWLQGIDGAVKAVKVELAQNGADIQARVLAAKYLDGASPGFDFETGGLTATLAGAYNSDGYGAFSLGLHTGSAPSNQAGQVTLSGNNSFFSGNLSVNRGRLVLGAGTSFDGGSSPSRGSRSGGKPKPSSSTATRISDGVMMVSNRTSVPA